MISQIYGYFVNCTINLAKNNFASRLYFGYQLSANNSKLDFSSC